MPVGRALKKVLKIVTFRGRRGAWITTRTGRHVFILEKYLNKKGISLYKHALGEA